MIVFVPVLYLLHYKSGKDKEKRKIALFQSLSLNDITNELIADFGDNELNQPIYLVNFGGKKALILESFLTEAK